jgi:hypothetical protein
VRNTFEFVAAQRRFGYPEGQEFRYTCCDKDTEVELNNSYNQLKKDVGFRYTKLQLWIVIFAVYYSLNAIEAHEDWFVTRGPGDISHPNDIFVAIGKPFRMTAADVYKTQKLYWRVCTEGNKGSAYSTIRKSLLITGGKKAPKATPERVKINGRLRIVYVDSAGHNYYKAKGAYIRLGLRPAPYSEPGTN